MRDATALMSRAVLVPRPGVDLVDEAAQLDANGHDPGDPPIFLLQAASTFAGGNLPDGVWQRVPIGAAGQVLGVDPSGTFPLWVNSPSGFVNPMTTLGSMIVGASGGAAIALGPGSINQVLTINPVTGSPAWLNSSAGLTNPMTTAEDMILGGTGGAPTRLAVGSNGQILTITAGIIGWANAAAGFANPMTTGGDLLFENATPAPARLPIGTTGQVLTVVGGLPAWAATSASLTNPMTTLGDLITGASGGAPQRLAAGGAGQVLGISAGVPAWISNPAGFVNPMTTVGDLLYEGTGPAPARLPIGTAGQALLVGGTGLPVWGTAPSYITASGDSTGVTDTAAIQASLTAGNRTVLAPGQFYIGAVGSSAAGLTVPGALVSGQPGGWLEGSGHGRTKLFYVGGTVSGGAGVYCHGTQAGGSAYQGIGAIIRHLEIDGSLVPSTALVTGGLDVGDQYDLIIEGVTVSNFTSTGTTNSLGTNPLGAVGIALNNYNTLSEKTHMRRCVVNNCTNAFQTTTISGAGTTSRMYSDIELHINLNANQNGWVTARQGHLENARLTIYGNMNAAGSGTNTASLIVMGVGSASPQAGHSFNMEVDINVEADPTASGVLRPTTITFGTNADNTITTWRGRMQFSYAGGWQQASNFTITPSGAFQFSGRLHGDASLLTAYPPYSGSPVSGTTYTNNGVDAMVCVAGGTVSAVAVNGNVTGLTSGSFLVPMNQTFAVTYTVLPLVGWFSALAS